LAKHTKPTLLLNFANEPFRPSLGTDRLKNITNMMDKQHDNKNRQCQTRTIWVSCLSHFLPSDVNASRAKNASVLDIRPPLFSFDLFYPMTTGWPEKFV
jgi:hypothetical protein